MAIDMELMVAVFFGLLFLIVGVIFYLKFVKVPKWNEYPEDFIAPDMSLDKKRKRRLRVAYTGSKHPNSAFAKSHRKSD
jgi:hypothetical protein